MAINFGLAGDVAGPLDILRAVGQEQMQQFQQRRLYQQARQEDAQFAQSQRILAGRPAIQSRLQTGDYTGAQQDAIANGDYDFAEHIGTLSQQHREQLGREVDTFGRVAYGLRQLPATDRAAAFEALKPQLRDQGFDDAQLQGANLSDAGLDGYVSLASNLKDQIAQHNADRTFQLDQNKFGETVRANDLAHQDRVAGQQVTMRGQDMSHADAAASRAVSIRGQDLSAATQLRTAGMQGQKQESQLRKEFDQLPEVKNFRTVRGQGQQILRLAKSPSAQNDIAMIFSYMKMLDPTSVVREGEFANAQNAAGIPDQIKNLYNRAQNGERLNAQQRAGIVSSANDIYTTQRDIYNERAGQYRGYAADNGADPNKVAPTYVNKPKASNRSIQIAPGITLTRVR